MADPAPAPAAAPKPTRKYVRKGTWKGLKRPYRPKSDPAVQKALGTVDTNPAGTPGEGRPGPDKPGKSPPPGPAAGPAPAPASPPPPAAAPPAAPPPVPVYTAEELAAQERKKIAEGIERLKSPKGLATCAKIYRAPWGIWQGRLRKKGCPVVVVPSDAESTDGGDALRELMLMFPGVWVKQLPLINLGLTIGLHYMAAADRVDLWEAGVAAGREMAGRARHGTAGTPIAAVAVPPPAAGPPASRPPGAPPEMFGGPGPSDVPGS